jgi:hypothetical protein
LAIYLSFPDSFGTAREFAPKDWQRQLFETREAPAFPAPASLRQIIIPRVFLDHAVGGELRHER